MGEVIVVKKNIIFIVSIISASLLYGMDDPVFNVEDPEVCIDPQRHAQPDNIPPLDFTGVNRTISRKPVGALTQRRTVVKNNVQVSDLIRAKSQYRQQEVKESSKRSDNRRKAIDNNSNRAGSNGDSPVPATMDIGNLMQQLTGQDMYQEEDMWDLLLVANPILHDFAAAKGLTLSEAKEYGQAMQDFDFRPKALIRYLKNNSGFKDNTVDNFEITQYKDIRKKDPRKYKMLLLELIDQVWTNTQENNNQQGTLMHNTHLGVQADQIETQKTSLLYRTVYLAASLAVALGTSAWGIYGQASGNRTAT